MYREDPTSDPSLRQAAVDLVSSSNYFSRAEFDTVFTSGSSPRDHANVSSRSGMIETKPKKQAERALLIGLEQNGVSKWDPRDSTSAKEKRRRSKSQCKARESPR